MMKKFVLDDKNRIALILNDVLVSILLSSFFEASIAIALDLLILIITKYLKLRSGIAHTEINVQISEMEYPKKSKKG